LTGALIWNSSVASAGPDIISSTAIANGVVYVGSNDGKVYAFGSPQQIPGSSPTVPEITPTLVLTLVAVTSVIVSLKKKKWSYNQRHSYAAQKK
jgi:outer membrane protein assembly factor BamB